MSMTAKHYLDQINACAPDRFTHRAEAAERFGEKAVRYAQVLTEGDPLADAVTDEIHGDRSGKGRRDLETALTSGLAAVAAPSPALVALFEHIEALPDWVDWDRIELGGIAILSRGQALQPSLAASLASGYNTGAGVKPLVRTGRLVSMAARRISETANWYYKTVCPGGLRAGAPGYLSTIRVRTIHSMVRRTLLRSSNWNSKAWGVPLNMADMNRGVASEFTSVPIDAGRLMGFNFTAAESDAVLHLFRYVGYLLGVPQDILPTNEAEARAFEELMLLVSDGPDEDCRALASALLEVSYQEMMAEGKSLKAWFSRSAGHGYVRAFAGKKMADELGLQDTIFKYMPYLGRPILKRRDRRIQALPYAERKRLACAYAEEILGSTGSIGVVDVEEAGRAVERKNSSSGKAISAA